MNFRRLLILHIIFAVIIFAVFMLWVYYLPTYSPVILQNPPSEQYYSPAR